jgi:hypothetical protein
MAPDSAVSEAGSDAADDGGVADEAGGFAAASYFSEDFESPDWASRFKVTSVFRESGAAAHGGSFGIRMHVDVGDHWGGEVRWEHPAHKQVGDFEEIWTRYYVKFGPNFGRDADIYIGKAGFRARSAEVCGAPCIEMTDSTNMAPSGSIRGNSYFHRHITKSDDANNTFGHYGKAWDPDGDRARGQWYCVETHIVMNQPGVADGVYQNWLDGKLVSDVHDAPYRDEAGFDIDHSVLIFYVGGSWTSDRKMDVYFDDWAVSDSRIGCL